MIDADDISLGLPYRRTSPGEPRGYWFPENLVANFLVLGDIGGNKHIRVPLREFLENWHLAQDTTEGECCWCETRQDHLYQYEGATYCASHIEAAVNIGVENLPQTLFPRKVVQLPSGDYRYDGEPISKATGAFLQSFQGYWRDPYLREQATFRVYKLVRKSLKTPASLDSRLRVILENLSSKEVSNLTEYPLATFLNVYIRPLEMALMRVRADTYWCDKEGYFHRVLQVTLDPPIVAHQGIDGRVQYTPAQEFLRVYWKGSQLVRSHGETACP